MDLPPSPYLEAIQAVAGVTPGQKYKELSLVARKVAADVRSHGDAAPQRIVVPDVPEPLVPLVRLEIANLLRKNEVIAETLKSDDCELIDRALRINWFYRSDNKDVMNVDYFKANLLPAISLNTRIKLIKVLAASFNAHSETALAEKFYALISKSYGRSQAEPLLVPCAESFVWDTLNKHKISLSIRMIKNLFIKYPELVLRYLKLSARDISLQSRYADITKYSAFLPLLIKSHLRSLIELIEMTNSSLDIKLSNKATERFIKGNADVVLARPTLYTRMMPLKVIAAKLTKSQYKTMFANAYPSNSKDFQYYMIEEYLQYYPEQEKVSLLLDTYKQVYNANMLDNHDVINAKILQILPAAERERQARIKLEKEPDWREKRQDVEQIWRCYLPIRETISSIKDEISKTSAAGDRSMLFTQMFFACRVNDDKDALLEVLRYFTRRHKNERPDVIFEALNSLVEYLDLSTFGKDHWCVLNDFMRFLHVKDELIQSVTTSRKILSSAIHFNLIHDLSIDENITMLIEMNMAGWNVSWCTLEKYPEYDRICFDKMMQIIPSKYQKKDKIWFERRVDMVVNIVESMGEFNARCVKAKNKIEKLSIKSYSWLVERVKKILSTGDRYETRSIREYLEDNEPDLYEELIYGDPNAIRAINMSKALKTLKADGQKILDRFDDYFKEIHDFINYNNDNGRFLKACRWYQHIPIKFVARCLDNLKKDMDRSCILMLGILMEGPAFVRFVEPFVPKDTSIDTTGEKAKSTYKLIEAIPHAMNFVNPPVSLNIVLNCCEDEYLNIGLTTLTNVCRRTSVGKVEKFTKNLAERRVALKKHGIRMFCLVATIDDYREFLWNLWTIEKHRSIRAVLFAKIRSLFIDQPSPENWKIMTECMIDLKIDDNDSFDSLVTLCRIPDLYVGDYVPKLFETLERLANDGLSPARSAKYISTALSNINESISNLLPEDISVQLLKKYFCNTSLSFDVYDDGMRYALLGYLRSTSGTKLDERLKIFGQLYEDILRQHWNVVHRKDSTHRPINWLTHKFVVDIVCRHGTDSKNVRIMETILERFLAILKPQQDWFTYALLIYGIALKDTEHKDPSVIAELIAEKLPNLVLTLSPILAIELAEIVEFWLRSLAHPDVHESAVYEVIEKLCRVGTAESCTVAAKLLFRSDDREHDVRHNNIVELLQMSEYPAVVSLVYQHVNTCNLIE